MGQPQVKATSSRQSPRGVSTQSMGDLGNLAPAAQQTQAPFCCSKVLSLCVPTQDEVFLKEKVEVS